MLESLNRWPRITCELRYQLRDAAGILPDDCWSCGHGARVTRGYFCGSFRCDFDTEIDFDIFCHIWPTIHYLDSYGNVDASSLEAHEARDWTWYWFVLRSQGLSTERLASQKEPQKWSLRLQSWHKRLSRPDWAGRYLGTWWYTASKLGWRATAKSQIFSYYTTLGNCYTIEVVHATYILFCAWWASDVARSVQNNPGTGAEWLFIGWTSHVCTSHGAAAERCSG